MDRYNRKIIFLVGLVGALALIYGASLIFDPEQMNARNASFVWLEAKAVDQADRIELSGAEGDLTLIKKNKRWFVFRDNTEYPAKQVRIEDFLRILSARESYPVRGTAASSHERLRLTPDTASRIVIQGGGGAAPLLDLLIGAGDSTGREIHLRKNGQQEVRSGEDRFSSYVDSRPAAWFNLRLFPEDTYPELKSEMVQRVTVYAPTSSEDEADPPAKPLVLTRSEGTWGITGAVITKVDNQRVETYIRGILEAEGDDFIAQEDSPALEGVNSVISPDNPAQTEADPSDGRILLELGNGQTLTLTVGPILESNQRSAQVGGSPLRYALAEWTLGRLFRRAGSYFEQL